MLCLIFHCLNDNLSNVLSSESFAFDSEKFVRREHNRYKGLTYESQAEFYIVKIITKLFPSR